MAKVVHTKIQLRSDTQINWAMANPVLLRGEAAFSTDVNKVKIGDGLSTWNQLEYIGDLTKLSQLENDKHYVSCELDQGSENLVFKD